MLQTQAAEILRIHLSEADRYGDQPLYEAIVARCRELNIAGATVFSGIEGYGETAEMHRARVLHGNRPIVIAVVDTAENIRRLTTVLPEMMETGMLAISPAQIARVRKSAAAR